MTDSFPASMPLPSPVRDSALFLSTFTVNDEGSIIDNGKFQGEMLWVPLLWTWIDEGDRLEGDEAKYSVEPQWMDCLTLHALSEQYPENKGYRAALRDLESIGTAVFVEDNDGFVSLVEYENKG